jgi:heme-degrading monooxygenase HmoA
MIIEHALLQIKPNSNAEFEAAFEIAQHIISSMQGYNSHELLKCIENPNQYLLWVKWDALEDHTIGFRTSPQYQEWKALLHHFYEPFPEVIHFSPIASLSKAD